MLERIGTYHNSSTEVLVQVMAGKNGLFIGQRDGKGAGRVRLQRGSDYLIMVGEKPPLIVRLALWVGQAVDLPALEGFFETHPGNTPG